MLSFEQCQSAGKHRGIIGVLYSVGFFLLFLALGAFGSAGVLTYKATHWIETAAQIQDCSLGEYDHGALFALHCGIGYQLAGRPYTNSLHSHLSRSLHERSEISHWIAVNRPGATLTIRVNQGIPRSSSCRPGCHSHKVTTQAI